MNVVPYHSPFADSCCKTTLFFSILQICATEKHNDNFFYGNKFPIHPINIHHKTPSKKYVNINGKVSKDKWQSMFRYLAKYVDNPFGPWWDRTESRTGDSARSTWSRNKGTAVGIGIRSAVDTGSCTCFLPWWCPVPSSWLSPVCWKGHAWPRSDQNYRKKFWFQR